jgi:hypothetical protein
MKCISLRLGTLKLCGTIHEHDIETVARQYYALTLLCYCTFSCGFQSELCVSSHSIISVTRVRVVE